MAYTIGCRWLDYGKEPFTVRKDTAQEALLEAENLQRSDVPIEYIDTPEMGRIGLDGLRIFVTRRTTPPV
jgi:hypothetical protein